MNAHGSSLLDQFADAFTEAGLSELFRELRHYARESIRIELTEAPTTTPVATSRIGGHPDLPREMQWPRNPATGDPMSFIAQFNCVELESVDVENQLPHTGMLYFFYDVEKFAWGFDPDDHTGSRVIYYDWPLDELLPAQAPEGAVTYPPHAVRFTSRVDIPEYTSQLITTELDDEEYERYLDLLEKLNLVGDNKLLGHSNNIQNGMELQCELVTNGIYCGSADAYRHPRLPELAPGRFTWQLLAQFVSDEEGDMQWGDEGTLYFWIRSEDLANRRFENAWQILQCY